MKQGVVYMAWGENAIRQTKESIHSLHQFCPEMEVLVLGDLETQEAFSTGSHVSSLRMTEDPFCENGARGYKFMAGRIKPLIAKLTPFEHTLYVDADTKFVRSPQVGFDLLDRWDLVVAETPNRSLKEGLADYKECTDSAAYLGSPYILYHNSGMIFWRRNERTLKLFELWSEEWLKYQNWDEQVALLRALMRSEVLFLTVPYTWNCNTSKEAFILHHRFGSADARIEMKRARPGPTKQDTRRIVEFEASPGIWVKIYDGDQDKVREQIRKKVKMTPNKGPLVIVEIGPHKLVKMYESDAIARGLPYTKERRVSSNKMVTPTRTKTEEPSASKAPTKEEVQTITDEAISQPDNFTEIPGIGKSTAEELYDHNILFFDDLAGVDVSELEWLNTRAAKAIEDWQISLEPPTPPEPPTQPEEDL